MSYFNHAFRKSFLATGPTQTSLTITNPAGVALGTAATTVNGYLNTAGLPTYALNQLSATQTDQQADQYIGFFNAKTQLSVNLASMTTSACPLILAGSAIYTNDKIGPLTGGYQETNKSKVINPRYISRAYRVDPCTGNNAVVHVGSTYWTAGGGVLTVNSTITGTNTLYATSATDVVAAPVTTTGSGTGMVISYDTTPGGKVSNSSVVILNPGKGYAVGDTVTIPYSSGAAGNAIVTILTVNAAGTDPVTGSGGAACCKEFMCGETYTLRLDIKGSPNLRYLDHNSYLLASAYTGCCPDGAIAPTPVNSTDVMVAWAKAIRNSPIVSPFVQVVVQDEAGTLWYAPGTSAAFLAAQGANTWDNYVIGQAHTTGACAGLILNGAYVDTKFGDCSFQISDFYEKEPVRLYPSEVDLNGDPCAFDGICVVSQCAPLQAQGFGETILRDMILSEAYRQNFFATDIRIREITQGNQILSSVDRSGLYYRYVIQHNVPRFNNPSSTFDNDQYLLEIYSKNALAQLATDLEAYVEAAQATGCTATYETFSCTPCDTFKPAFPTVPTYNPFNTQGL